MNGLKNFVIGSLGTLGAMEAVDAQILSPRDTDTQTLIIRSVVTLVAGILSTVISRWLKKHKGTSHHEMIDKDPNSPKIKNTVINKKQKNK
ncbi:hypothetical protein E9993_19230 [Labilibacter sediminis]|nr:hypothetical protein E9993_19230 [Labilibacter sediminis]